MDECLLTLARTDMQPLSHANNCPKLQSTHSDESWTLHRPTIGGANQSVFLEQAFDPIL